ncbi:hypothetical protein [Gilliamella sp. ESL0250]|uniref:hypothetical protein n=1 Tax=Gilliamella sp. ESL0250 TaxID=2705036 RepID=UPI0015812046|nr:hypothetical protein [Gilliamella sp. ESL0250]NUF50204.1 hypothetical protein [Gilliamella sp. ESL0250]
MHYYIRHQSPSTRHWQTYVLNLPNNPIRRVFTRTSFISSKLSLKLLSKLSRKVSLALVLLLLSYSWSLQALPANNRRAGNRSDAIILPPSPLEVIKFVRPVIKYGADGYAGPADIWNPHYGFLVQSTNPASYGLNFPTTGADGLYFDLIIMGEARDLRWESPIRGKGITVTVARRPIFNSDGDVEYRVTLNGQHARAHINNPHPRRIDNEIELPQTFELVGKNRSGEEIVRYGFVLQKWYVNRGRKFDTFQNQLSWCSSLGYRMVQVKDLTNSACRGSGSGPHCRGAISATPHSTGNHYQRRIGAGFSAEWGDTGIYTRAGFENHFYWTSDAAGGDYQFTVFMGGGYIGNHNALPNNTNYYGLCTTP